LRWRPGDHATQLWKLDQAVRGNEALAEFLVKELPSSVAALTP